MKRFILLLSFFLIICFCFSAGCSSFSKHTVSDTEEIQTEIFLDKPDFLICITNGNEKQCSSDSLETIYDAFMDLRESFCQAGSLKTPFQSTCIEEWKQKDTCFEFRYRNRRNYVGMLDDEENLFSWGELRFDAFLFVYYSNGLIAVPYIGNDYVGINDLFLFLTFPEERLNEFIDIVQG